MFDVKPFGFRRAALAFAVWAAAAAIFFRIPLLSGFDFTSGDVADGRLINYVHEHLYRWLLGQAQFNSPAMFYPQPNVLGYSDAHILNLPPYAAFRALGLDPFLSAQFVGILLSLLCFFCVTVILTCFFNVRLAIALGAAVIATFPNNLFVAVEAGHTTMFAMYYIPLVALIALRGLKDFPRVTPGSVACVALAALLYGLLFATSYYTAWLFALTGLIAIVTALIALRRELPGFLSENARPVGILTAAAVAGFVAGLIPFALIYGPVIAEVPRRVFGEYLIFAPQPPDIINASHQNAIWGSLVKALRGVRSMGGWALAVTPGMTLIFLALAFYTTRRSGTTARWTLVLLAVCASVWAFSWILTAKIGTVSAYWLLYKAIPGADAIRLGIRIQLFVNLWIAFGLALLLNEWANRAAQQPQSRLPKLAVPIMLLCVAEQFAHSAAPGNPRAAGLAALAAVPQPPPECKSFLVDVPGDRNIGDVTAQNDAMWISIKTGLPTLNGESGLQPPGWRLVYWPGDYFEKARAWIERKNVAGQVCFYERGARRWSPFPLK